VNGDTALHVAAAKGQLEAVRVLLESGADSLATNLKGRTPVDWAAGGGQMEALRLLVDQFAKEGKTNVREERARSSHASHRSGDGEFAPRLVGDKRSMVHAGCTMHDDACMRDVRCMVHEGCTMLRCIAHDGRVSVQLHSSSSERRSRSFVLPLSLPRRESRRAVARVVAGPRGAARARGVRRVRDELRHAHARAQRGGRPRARRAARERRAARQPRRPPRATPRARAQQRCALAGWR
jgi:hypothetical protein